MLEENAGWTSEELRCVCQEDTGRLWEALKQWLPRLTGWPHIAHVKNPWSCTSIIPRAFMSCNGISLPFKKCSTIHQDLRKPTMINVSSCKPIIISGEPLIAFSHPLRAFCITFRQAMFCQKAHSSAWWHNPAGPTTPVVLHVFHLLSSLSPLSLPQLQHSVLHSTLIFHTSISTSPFRYVTISCAWRHKKQTIRRKLGRDAYMKRVTVTC